VLEKKVAIVVGAANGIGRATALAFAAAGAAVTCADVEEAGARTTAAEIDRGGAEALPIHLDVTEGASCRAAVAATVERFGGLDVLLYGAADSDPSASRLTRLECRVRPLRDGNLGLLAVYDGFFSAGRLALGELSAAVIELATELRARYWFSTPDAIHLATAIEGGADVVLTGDATLRRCREVTVEVLES